MKTQKYCLCCDTIAEFRIYRGKTAKSCDSCNQLYTRSQRDEKILVNVLKIVKPVIDKNI